MQRVVVCILAMTCSLYAYASQSWVLNPPTFEGYIVGVGVGSDRLVARNAALSEIVTQLSVDFTVEQVQVLSATDDVAQVRFTQASQLLTIPVSLEGVEELKSGQFDHQFALILGIKKATLIASLHDKLTLISRISPVAGNPSKQFIWALTNGEQLDLANKQMRVLQGLGEDVSVYTERLSTLLLVRQKALDAVAVQVIASHELSQLKSAMSLTIPQSGATPLWLKANLKWKYSKQSNPKKALAQLSLTLTESKAPFKVLLQRTLVSEASAKNLEAAKSLAMKKLQSQVAHPISHWMLENH